MADLERRLISRGLTDHDFGPVFVAGITPDFFLEPEHQSVFSFVKGYWQAHRSQDGRPVTPTVRRVKEEFPAYSVVRVEDPLTDCIDRLKALYQERILREATSRLIEALKIGDRGAATEAMATGLRQATSEVSTTEEEKLSEVLTDHIEMLIGRKNGSGMLGHTTGFDTINRATLGLQAGQFITVAGVDKVGKSSLLMVMARHLQATGKVPWFLSFEMSNDEQIGRYIAMGAHVEYRRLVSGQLTDTEVEHLREFNVRASELSEFHFCADRERAATLTGLESKLVQRLPDVAFVDGVYLMRDEESGEQNTSTALTNITRGIKRMAQRLDIPIVVSTQALRSKTRKGKLDSQSPGYSSSFAQDSDVLLGLERYDNRPDERLLRIIVSRHCPPTDVWVEWDWKRGYFGDEREVVTAADDEEDDDGA